MALPDLIRLVCLLWLGVAVVVFVVLLFISAPYGRHTRGGWGPMVDRRTGWLIMEAPPWLAMVALFVVGGRAGQLVPTVLLVMWLVHYLHRDLVFPLRMRGRGRPMPWSGVAMAVVFTLVNGGLNGAWLFVAGPARDASWLLDPRFVVGAWMFVVGFVINLHSDEVLHRLRDGQAAPTHSGTRCEAYQVPHGGLYRWISCPNYLGEVLEWTGWAIATWSLPGATFAIWTAANLLPRALSNHRWYRSTFADYPRERRAIIPWVL
jgi:protein-S-isoprenylcysteine O-methyltransferase Ste14